MTEFRGKIYLLAALVGTAAGLFGAGFHFALDKALLWRVQLQGFLRGGPVPGWLMTMLLGAGMIWLARWMVRRFAPETAGSGIQEIEGVLEGVRPLNWRRVLPVKFIGGWLAIAAGFVLGREGPTVHMASALGKMVGDGAGLPRQGIQSLIAAGAGAGLAAAFNAPVAGIIFVTEEMRRQFDYNFVSLHCVILACCIATVVNDIWLAQGPFLPIPVTTYPQTLLADLPLFVLLGAFVGVFGWLFNAGLLRGLDLMDWARDRNEHVVALFLGAAAGVLVWVLPEAVSGGETLIEAVVVRPVVLGALMLLLVIRTFTSVMSYAAGLPGGIFAPMLALGTLAGLSFGSAARAFLPAVTTEPGVFAVAAMGALFSATVRAPVTGIILVAELTNSYQILLASTLTCVAASVTAQALGGQPIYTLLLRRTLGIAQKQLGQVRDRTRSR